MIVTVDHIMALGPCQPDWPRERVRRLIGGGVSPAPLAEIVIEHASKAEGWWLFSRLLDLRQRMEWCCDCAGRALPVWESRFPGDRRPREAVDAARAAIADPLTCGAAAWAAYAAHRAADSASVGYDAASSAAYAARATAQAAYVVHLDTVEAPDLATKILGDVLDSAELAVSHAICGKDTGEEYAWQLRYACDLLEA